MDYGGSYQNSGGFGSSGVMSETEYQRLSQTVGTNIQKMIQNGGWDNESTIQINIKETSLCLQI